MEHKDILQLVFLVHLAVLPFTEKYTGYDKAGTEEGDRFGFAGSTSISTELALQITAKQVYPPLSSSYQQRHKMIHFWVWKQKTYHSKCVRRALCFRQIRFCETQLFWLPTGVQTISLEHTERIIVPIQLAARRRAQGEGRINCMKYQIKHWKHAQVLTHLFAYN